MVRRRKDPKLRMAKDLRIPVTDELKRLIEEATSDEPEGMAAWARGVLREAAQRKVSGRERPQEPPDEKA